MSIQREKLVLLHGFLGCPAIWEYWISKLETRFEIFCPSLPGHCGREVLQNGHEMDSLADWVLQQYHLEYGDSRAHWVGHSMGGYVGLAALARSPERVESLSLVNSSPFADGSERRAHRLRSIDAAKSHKETYVAQTVKALFDTEFANSSPEMVNRAVEWGKKASTEGIVSSLSGMLARPDRGDLVLENKRLIRFIQGANDPVISSEDRHRMGAFGCPVAELPTGHMSMLEAPEESLEVFLEMLK